MLNRLLGNNVTFNKFIEAAKTGGNASLATVQRFIEQNRNNVANINHANQDGNTALIWAAYKGHAAIVTALLAIPGIDINHANQDGNTALTWAASNGHAAIVTALLAIPGIDINAVNQYGNTALIWAAIKGHAAIVTALLAIPGIDINAVGRNCDTALHWGAYKGNETIVKALLTKITNVNDLKRENNDHHTPAQEAERQGHPGIAALIVARITELERLQNNLEEKNPNPPAPIVPKITFKEQLKGIYEGEPPPRLCCPISFDLMEDPITPYCGITFDRKSLVDLFKQKGNPTELPWAEANGITIKRSELTMPTSKTIRDMLQDFVDEQKEKHKNNNLNEGIASILKEEKEEKVRPADEQFEDILLLPALDFANPLQAEPSLVANHNELKQEDVNLEKLIATKNLAEAFLKSFEGLTKSFPSTVNQNQSAESEAKIPAPKSPATIERERMIASRLKLLGEKPKLNPALSPIPSSAPTINSN